MVALIGVVLLNLRTEQQIKLGFRLKILISVTLTNSLLGLHLLTQTSTLPGGEKMKIKAQFSFKTKIIGGRQVTGPSIKKVTLWIKDYSKQRF